jgi:hypothetical protein
MSKKSPQAKMADARTLALKAEQIAMQAIEEHARVVLKKHKIATEYCQAMGTWGFMMEVPNTERPIKFELTGRSDTWEDADAILDRQEDESPVTQEQGEQILDLIEDVKKHDELVQEYNNLFGSEAAGTPMRFTADGPKRTDW